MDYLLERIHPAFLAGLIALVLLIPLFGVLVAFTGDTLDEYLGMCIGTSIGTVIGNFIGMAICKKL